MHHVAKWTVNHTTMRNKPTQLDMSFSGALRVAIRRALNNYRTHLVQSQTLYGGQCVIRTRDLLLVSFPTNGCRE
jgi:hypothetical protein